NTKLALQPSARLNGCKGERAKRSGFERRASPHRLRAERSETKQHQEYGRARNALHCDIIVYRRRLLLPSAGRYRRTGMYALPRPEIQLFAARPKIRLPSENCGVNPECTCRCGAAR